MITHIPKDKDFENAGIDSLCQSIYFIYQIRKQADEVFANLYYDKKDSIWAYHQSILRTCLISLFQGIEILMKSVISANSPLLLIENKRKDWPTLPDRADKDFDKFYTIAGDSLLTTFFAVQKHLRLKSEKIEFNKLFEELRSKRNKAMHGLLKDDISPEYIISNVLKAFTIFYSKDKWLISLIKNFKENPILDIFDKETSIALFNMNMDYIEEFIGKAGLNKNLTTDVRKRKYFCPKCFESLTIIFDKPKSKWAFLVDGEKVKCLICNKSHDIIRDDCIKDNCKGDVLFKKKKLCLTCGEINQVTTGYNFAYGPLGREGNK